MEDSSLPTENGVRRIKKTSSTNQSKIRGPTKHGNQKFSGALRRRSCEWNCTIDQTVSAGTVNATL